MWTICVASVKETCMMKLENSRETWTPFVAMTYSVTELTPEVSAISPGLCLLTLTSPPLPLCCLTSLISQKHAEASEKGNTLSGKKGPLLLGRERSFGSTSKSTPENVNQSSPSRPLGCMIEHDNTEQWRICRRTILTHEKRLSSFCFLYVLFNLLYFKAPRKIMMLKVIIPKNSVQLSGDFS